MLYDYHYDMGYTDAKDSQYEGQVEHQTHGTCNQPNYMKEMYAHNNNLRYILSPTDLVSNILVLDVFYW